MTLWGSSGYRQMFNLDSTKLISGVTQSLQGAPMCLWHATHSHIAAMITPGMSMTPWTCLWTPVSGAAYNNFTEHLF
jgi:hypothetical protein